MKHWGWLAVVVGLALAAGSAGAQAAVHTNPLNLDPMVRQGYERFYNMDFDSAIKIFNQVAQQHPQDPMAWDYIQMATIFHELYHQDLLDTTYYAHDSFLSNKRDVPMEAATRQRIEDLSNKVIAMCDAEIAANPNDKNAYFARGYAKGMHAVFITLAEHSFAAAARQGYASRNDSDQVLKLDPQYADADMAVGLELYAVASLPRWVRIVVGAMGVGGNKQQGLADLREASAHGVVTSVESKTALSLFLRHDGRYAEALEVQRGLAAEYPHDFLFQLEVANLLKDEGHGLEAIAEYKKVLADAARPGYFTDARLQLAWFGLGDTQRGYNQIPDAANSFLQAAEQSNCSDWLRRRAQLNAGEMYDLLHDRAQAVKLYQMAAAPGGDQTQADTARKYLKTPYVVVAK